MADKRVPEFGKRRPAAIGTAQPPVKRSSHVALFLMGTFAVGGGAYALIPAANCEPKPGMAADVQSNAGCAAHGSGSGGHGWSGGWSSRNGFYSSDASSSRSPSAAASDSSTGVTRGGFGSFAHAFAGHFSGGG